jgi:hypothetical protein
MSVFVDASWWLMGDDQSQECVPFWTEMAVRAGGAKSRSAYHDQGHRNSIISNGWGRWCTGALRCFFLKVVEAFMSGKRRCFPYVIPIKAGDLSEGCFLLWLLTPENTNLFDFLQGRNQRDWCFQVSFLFAVEASMHLLPRYNHFCYGISCKRGVFLSILGKMRWYLRLSSCTLFSNGTTGFVWMLEALEGTKMMPDSRKPFISLLAFLNQVIEAAACQECFANWETFHLIVPDAGGHYALHIRVYLADVKGERQRVVQVMEYDMVRHSYDISIRMRADGWPLDLLLQEAINVEQAAYYQMKTVAFRFERHIREATYLSQAALSYTLRRGLGIDDLYPPDTTPWSLSFITISEQHYAKRLQPIEGIYVQERVGRQGLAARVLAQYQALLDAFTNSSWLELALVRATIAARFQGKYYLILTPYSCYTTWQIDEQALPVSALCFTLPALEGESEAANYVDPQGHLAVHAEAQLDARRDFQLSVRQLSRDKDLQYLYCPRCWARVARSIEAPPYTCKKCSWHQNAF